MDCYYKLRHLFYYKVRHGLLQIATEITKPMDLLQIATGITKCDDYYKLRQYTCNTARLKSDTVLAIFWAFHYSIICISFCSYRHGKGLNFILAL